MYNEYSFSLDVSEDTIAHHGILGMKWGKTNGPPYPLNSGDHSSEEVKAAKAAGSKLGKDSGKGSIENVKSKGKSSSSFSKSQNQKEEKSEKKGLSSNQKKAIAVGAVAVGVAVSAYAGYKIHQAKTDTLPEISGEALKTPIGKLQQSINDAAFKSTIKDPTLRLSYNESIKERNHAFRKQLKENGKIDTSLVKNVQKTYTRLDYKAKTGKDFWAEHPDNLAKQATQVKKAVQQKATQNPVNLKDLERVQENAKAVKKVATNAQPTKQEKMKFGEKLNAEIAKNIGTVKDYGDVPKPQKPVAKAAVKASVKPAQAQDYNDALKKMQAEFGKYAKDASASAEKNYGDDLVASLLKKNAAALAHSDEPNDYLEHHGILGQKWGKQNGPPYPLTTSAHERVVKSATSEERYSAVSRGGGEAASLHTSNSKKQDKGLKINGLNLSDIKAVSIKDISTSKKYLDTYLLGKNEVDTVLKSNTKFSRIQTSQTVEDHAFYATYKKQDVNKYIGLFGNNLRTRAYHTQKENGEEKHDIDIYQVKLRNEKKLRVPSDDAATKVTMNLLKDDDFKSNLKKSIDDTKEGMRRPNQQLLLNRASKLLDRDPKTYSDKDKKDIYKALNLSLTNHNEYEIAAQNKFYGALKKKGYGALVDLNDQKYSSYHAKRPMIVFDTSSIATDSIRKVSNEKMDKYGKIYNTERFLKEIPQNVLKTPISAISGNY